MSAGSNELVYIGLGANLDQPQQQIEEALRRIALVPGASLRAASAMYRSGPWGRQDQPDFINAIAAVDTMLSPACAAVPAIVPPVPNTTTLACSTCCIACKLSKTG